MLFVFFLLLALGIVGASSWGLMLVVGIMHNDWWAFIPPMGFKTAFLIVLVPTVISIVIHSALAVVKSSAE